jgi:hypothetical protein
MKRKRKEIVLDQVKDLVLDLKTKTKVKAKMTKELRIVLD